MEDREAMEIPLIWIWSEAEEKDLIDTARMKSWTYGGEKSHVVGLHTALNFDTSAWNLIGWPTRKHRLFVHRPVNEPMEPVERQYLLQNWVTRRPPVFDTQFLISLMTVSRSPKPTRSLQQVHIYASSIGSPAVQTLVIAGRFTVIHPLRWIPQPVAVLE